MPSLVPIRDRMRVGAALGILLPGDGRLFGLTAHSLLVSQDAGQTWAVAGLSKGALSVVRLDDLWFAGGPSGVFKSQDLTTWTDALLASSDSVAGGHEHRGPAGTDLHGHLSITRPVWILVVAGRIAHDPDLPGGSLPAGPMSA